MKANEAERNHQGAVDKSFSEQQIRIVDANYILYKENWTHTHSGTGSYGRHLLLSTIVLNYKHFIGSYSCVKQQWCTYMYLHTCHYHAIT